jgi:hypothetical protein
VLVTLNILQETGSAQGTFSTKLQKSVSSLTNTQGKLFNYTFVVENSALPGDSNSFTTIYNVTVTDNFPVGVAPTKKHWFKGGNTTSTCAFSGTDSRVMRCSIGRLDAEQRVEFTVEAKADGKNFAGKTAVKEVLNNTATLTCSGNKTATKPDASCTKTSKASTTVSVTTADFTERTV